MTKLMVKDKLTLNQKYDAAQFYDESAKRDDFEWEPDLEMIEYWFVLRSVVTDEEYAVRVEHTGSKDVVIEAVRKLTDSVKVPFMIRDFTLVHSFVKKGNLNSVINKNTTIVE